MYPTSFCILCCSDPQLNVDDSSSDTSRGHARKPSSSSNNSSPLHTPLHLSASNPDLSSLGGYSDDGRASDYPEHVLRIYRADQTCKYILLHRVSDVKLHWVMSKSRQFEIYFGSYVCNRLFCSRDILTRAVLAQGM